MNLERLPTSIAKYHSVDQLSNIVSRYKARKILFVTGKHSFEMCGAKSFIESTFHTDDYFVFNDFSVNPKLEDSIKGARLALQHQIDIIVAIGGGSVMDIAKLIKAFIPSIENAEAIAKSEMPVINTTIPLIAVPTTAGSGSEATHFAVVYIGKQKFSLADQCLLPDAAILDGTLLYSASPYQKAINGLDALAQAIEGCWAVKSTSETRIKSILAIQLLMAHLPSAINQNSMEDLQKIMYAAHLAGQVINVTKTTAPHAFSYSFTSNQGIPHGHAVWLTLPTIFELHLNAREDQIIDPRGPDHLYQVMNRLVEALSIKGGLPEVYLKAFMKKIGVEPEMKMLGVNTIEDRLFASKQVNRERLKNNPMRFSKQNIAKIFYL